MSNLGEKLITIIVLDDHPILRKGVSMVISNIDPEIEVIQSGSFKDCSEIIELYKPALIVADLNLPDTEGIDSLKNLRKITDTPILVYSLKPEELVGPACYKEGAQAYVMKDACSENLESAIVTVLDGGTWCSPSLAAKLMASKSPQTKGNSGNSGNSANSGTSGIENLSERELEVFENIGKGQAIKEIAFDLNLSPKTVESHRDRIKNKLNLNNSTELTIKAKEWLTG